MMRKNPSLLIFHKWYRLLMLMLKCEYRNVLGILALHFLLDNLFFITIDKKKIVSTQQIYNFEVLVALDQLKIDYNIIILEVL